MFSEEIVVEILFKVGLFSLIMFPEEIVEEILFRLPVRDLLRLRCVCKSWCALIDSPRFIKKQHDNQRAICKEQGDVPLLLDSFSSNTQLYLLSKIRYGDVPLCLNPDLERDVALSYPNNLERLEYLRLLAVVNGIALLLWDCHVDSSMALWNPATREFMFVPFLRTEYINHVQALGFDEKSNDFKIIRSIYIKSTRNAVDTYEIYSLKTKSWKNIEDPRLNYIKSVDGPYCVCEGYIYWSCNSLLEGGNDMRYQILSFDFNNEVFKVLDPPPSETYRPSYGSCLATYMDTLAYLCHTMQNFEESYSSEEVMQHFEIWVMAKSDDPEIPSSWKHLFTIGPITGYHRFNFMSIRMDGDILFTIDYRRSQWSDDEEERSNSALYNPTTNTFGRRFGIEFDDCYEYVESLFRLSNTKANT